MATLENLEESIRPITEAALKAGFTVYTLKKEHEWDKAGFVYVCLDTNGSFACISQPTHPWDETELSAEIKPSRDYGSSVTVDYDGTIAGAVEALRKVCQSPNVTVRFVAKRGQAAPVVPNYGRQVIERWPGGPERFEVVTLATTEDVEA